jgi:hypothetical protein
LMNSDSALDLAVFKANIDDRTALRRWIVNNDHRTNLPLPKSP